MFDYLRAIFGFKRAVKDFEKRRKAYLVMPAAELEALPENELFDAALGRTEEKVDRYEDTLAGVGSLPDAAKTFYIASCYEMEVNNGGLCQFFVNSSREIAPLLPDALSAIGADGHRELLETFVTQNAIDLNDLSSFISDTTEEYDTQTKRYPFEDFDLAFEQLPPIRELLIPYVRKYLSEF